jgi:hypothetical protein
MQLEQVPVLAQLDVKVLVEPVKVFLQLLLRYRVPFEAVRGVVVNVGKEDGLGELGLDVLSGTPVSVPARPDLEVEGAVDAILLGSAAR